MTTTMRAVVLEVPGTPGSARSVICRSPTPAMTIDSSGGRDMAVAQISMPTNKE